MPSPSTDKAEMRVDWVLATGPQTSDVINAIPFQSAETAALMLERAKKDYPKTYGEAKVYRRVSHVTFVEEKVDKPVSTR